MIGASTGILYRTGLSDKKEIFSILKQAGCKAIEINLTGRISVLDTLTEEEVKDFSYVSVHLPTKDMATDPEKVLKKVSEAKIKIDAVLFHPDVIKDWDVLKKYDLPYAIENMDALKKTGKDVASLKKFFENIDMKFVLDVNHVFTNDTSMQLAKDLLAAFGERLTHVHISGYEAFHEPLFRTQQQEIIDAAPKHVPWIIESVVDTKEEIEQEVQYLATQKNS